MVLDVTTVAWPDSSFLPLPNSCVVDIRGVRTCSSVSGTHFFWVFCQPQGSKISSDRVYITFILGYVAFFFQIARIMPWLNVNFILCLKATKNVQRRIGLRWTLHTKARLGFATLPRELCEAVVRVLKTWTTEEQEATQEPSIGRCLFSPTSLYVYLYKPNKMW
jgi:hypothetical protein